MHLMGRSGVARCLLVVKDYPVTQNHNVWWQGFTLKEWTGKCNNKMEDIVQTYMASQYIS